MSGTKTGLIGAGAMGCIAATIAACTTKNDTPAVSTTTAAAVAGPADTHCGTKVQTVSAASCKAVTAKRRTREPQDSDAGDAGTGQGEDQYPATMYNSEGDDDDCKYHVTWASSSVAQNADVTFSVTAKKKSDGTPVTGAAPRLEVFLTDTHPAPNTVQVPTETAPGAYTVGPIRFDAKGAWTVRFHLNEDCSDLQDDSPHGHAAFYVTVP